VSAAGDLVAIAAGNTVALYSLPGGHQVRTVTHPANVDTVAFATAGHDLVSASIDGSVLITRDGRESFMLPAFPGGVDVVGFVPNGHVVAAGAHGRLRVYNPDLATMLAELDLPIRARSFRMSSDGRRMIIIPTNTTPVAPVLWDLEHDRIIARLEGHKGQVFSARFVRGDREILTAGGDGAARRWDGETGRLRQAYLRSSRFLLDAALDPSESTVVTAGSDGVLRFWDVPTGAMIWTLLVHRSAVNGVHFEGNEVVTRSFTGEISRWELPSLGAASSIEELVRCLPLGFDERTGGLQEQKPCNAPVRRVPN
jgi:WD40 repeat protein